MAAHLLERGTVALEEGRVVAWLGLGMGLGIGLGLGLGIGVGIAHSSLDDVPKHARDGVRDRHLGIGVG